MVRRMLVSCTGCALAALVVLTPAAPQAQARGGPPATPVQGGLPAVSAQVQAIQTQVANLSAALNALSTQVGTGNAALQAQINALSTQLTGFQQLLEQFNQALGNAETDLASLKGKVADLEAEVAALGGGLTSYDQLAGLPCTTALGTQGHVTLVGLLKSPICANGISANGRFIDFGPIVLDTQTNLLWEKKTTAVGSGANVGDHHDVDNTYNWCVATGNSSGFCTGNTTSWIGQVNAGAFAGFSDWRVATRDELLDIFDVTAGPPHIHPIFGPTQAGFYWSSSEVSVFVARGVSFLSGFTDGLKGSEGHVRAVRAGP